MLIDTGALVQRRLEALLIDGIGDLSFTSAWSRLLEFERNGRSYMPGTIMHSDHYNPVQRLAAMLLREVGTCVMQQFSSAVDWELVPYKFPLSERSRFSNEISFFEDEDQKLQNSKMSHSGLAIVLAGGGGGDVSCCCTVCLLLTLSLGRTAVARGSAFWLQPLFVVDWTGLRSVGLRLPYAVTSLL